MLLINEAVPDSRYPNIYADTVRTVEGYADCLVLRHFSAGSAAAAASVAQRPIISAGDGPGQHPTQVHTQVTMCGTHRPARQGFNH